MNRNSIIKFCTFGRKYFTLSWISTCGCYHELSEKTKGTNGFLSDEHWALPNSCSTSKFYMSRVDHFPVHHMCYLSQEREYIWRGECKSRTWDKWKGILSISRRVSQQTLYSEYQGKSSSNANEIPPFQVTCIEYQLIYLPSHQLKYFILPTAVDRIMVP